MATGGCRACGQWRSLYDGRCAGCIGAGRSGRSRRARFGNAGADLGAPEFIERLKSQLNLGDRQIGVRVQKSLGLSKNDDVYVNYINLPKGIGGAGGGAEAENNRMSFWVWGFGVDGAPPPTGKVKLEMSNSALPRTYKLRGRTAAPAAIAKYLADFLNKVAAEVPPHFTHTRSA
jgi:hypothetical protein